MLRVLTSSGNYGKPEKALKSSMLGKIMEFEKTLNNHGKIMELDETTSSHVAMLILSHFS